MSPVPSEIEDALEAVFGSASNANEMYNVAFQGGPYGLQKLLDDLVYLVLDEMDVKDTFYKAIYSILEHFCREAAIKLQDIIREKSASKVHSPFFSARGC